MAPVAWLSGNGKSHGEHVLKKRLCELLGKSGRANARRLARIVAAEARDSGSPEVWRSGIRTIDSSATRQACRVRIARLSSCRLHGHPILPNRIIGRTWTSADSAVFHRLADRER
jgi:hypothetical protein